MLGEDFKYLKNIFLADLPFVHSVRQFIGAPCMLSHLLSAEQIFIPKEQLFALQK